MMQPTEVDYDGIIEKMKSHIRDLPANEGIMICLHIGFEALVMFSLTEGKTEEESKEALQELYSKFLLGNPYPKETRQ